MFSKNIRISTFCITTQKIYVYFFAQQKIYAKRGAFQKTLVDFFVGGESTDPRRQPRSIGEVRPIMDVDDIKEDDGDMFIEDANNQSDATDEEPPRKQQRLVASSACKVPQRLRVHRFLNGALSILHLISCIHLYYLFN